MKRKAMDCDVPNLPEQIVRNILQRLPVKSLIRFQCVCKPWKNLIKNQSFAADHLQQSSHQTPPSLIFQCDRYSTRCCFRLLDWKLQVRNVQSFKSLNGVNKIVGSCNGLVCVQTDNPKPAPTSFSLWNPTTSAVRYIPVRTDKRTPCVNGFGFSPIVNDYVIVKAHNYHVSVDRVEVFSYKSGLWKDIDIGNLKGVSLKDQTASVDGIIFWSGEKLGVEEDGSDEVKVVVSFDIAMEVFTVIPMPDFEVDGDDYLSVYDNKLAIIVYTWRRRSPKLVDLWVFGEGTCASEMKWKKIKRYNNISLDSATTWSNAIICEPPLVRKGIEEDRNVLCLMDTTTDEFKRFVIPYCGHVHKIYNHVESLVSVWPSRDGFFLSQIERFET